MQLSSEQAPNWIARAPGCSGYHPISRFASVRTVCRSPSPDLVYLGFNATRHINYYYCSAWTSVASLSVADRKSGIANLGSTG